MESLKSFIVIPARLQSTRLRRKLLLCETGKPLIQHTYESAQRSKRAEGICVATDTFELAEIVRSFDGIAMMTDIHARSGTDRVAELARSMPDIDLFVNVQGDEPDVSGEAIDKVIGMLESDPSAVMATLATPIRTKEKLDDPACVKVAFNQQGQALYFSRSWIPFARDWNPDLLHRDPPIFFQHIGLYAYRREFLNRIAELPPSRLEELEKLEQLRVLDAGYTILVDVVAESAAGIDTREDYDQFVVRYLASMHKAA